MASDLDPELLVGNHHPPSAEPGSALDEKDRFALFGEQTGGREAGSAGSDHNDVVFGHLTSRRSAYQTFGWWIF